MKDTEKLQLAASILEFFPDYSHYLNHFMNLQKYDLTKNQWKALIIIANSSTLSMSQLAQRMNISREQASRTIAPLADRKLVERKINAENRRQIDISLSKEGRQLFNDLKSSTSNLICRSMDKLSEEEISEFKEAFKIIMKTLNKILYAD
ncbi:Uncharacterized HTH-type transcriptional regulator yusO [uncultured Roseburia sp.]|uniref:MarR family transcriptional regulator n=1 Tax=Brotonthovivens ammoniilytica TaxID=2981725 RepID=A0ABT2THU6_9FIRM|nr:MarR family transcriptional regulator [Brotonthovivens ammoniilytica]MCU6761769.1 MarR family transcriptional regulator [Brotonthovivens ammoniilytica]SCI46044.1 Uncharacterized HTH-type transcriptional regulator yusO [uncultured Roseburia sp.]